MCVSFNLFIFHCGVISFNIVTVPFFVTISYSLSLTLSQSRRDDALNDRQVERWETVNQAAKMMMTIVNDVLDLNKMESDRVSLTPLSFRCLHSCLSSLASLPTHFFLFSHSISAGNGMHPNGFALGSSRCQEESPSNG